uniref:glutathione synthase n=1 Tax=Thaumasiovibrio occultus TaxID=1891184 RepID=UPI000B351480|nr:glutathione synthase [Thaumasiovibrio occultus]
MNTQTMPLIPQHVVEDLCEWAIMHGVAIKNPNNTARHCPFSVAPMTIERDVYQHLLTVTPLISKLVSAVSEDHDYLQASLRKMADADPFFDRLMELHHQAHCAGGEKPAREPLLLMRTDYMDDRRDGAKVIEFNGIAAGMGPFGQRAAELHNYVREQWPSVYNQWVEDTTAQPAANKGLEQLALGIATAARKIKADFNEDGQPLFVMVVQKHEDNVYDQHLLEVELQRLGIKTVRRTFDQLYAQLSSGEDQRLMLQELGGVDVVYLRAGYQLADYCAPELDGEGDAASANCCRTLSLTRLFIEQHRVAVNATLSQQLATSKSMQMILTLMPAEEYQRWGLTLEEAQLVKSVLAEMKPVNAQSITWFKNAANINEWVLKNQGEGGGHCIFADDILPTLEALPAKEYDAWALMQRLYPHERDTATVAVRDASTSQVDDLVSEIGLFTAHFNGEPVTDFDGYAGYLIRSKPARENEGGIHSGKGILDSLILID